ncbi:NMDA receptor-regulated protein 1-domain-containing protein [Schizophyllum amplum]|uniref:NMDA receptor-regulated protein 1-domain-containing protein n=1 Tax=Schizophyllum amplum TaxID=97359 RepID=A0A550C6I2_9AGAR|nr:NMDA receptor-regulated protein 1-domain-containing protein [Auriculariopsis ampla]
MSKFVQQALQKRQLPSKESSLFKELLELYERKLIKKGLKTADAILKKFPEHGETLCMKGLLLTHSGRREEGLELVKKGVRLDLTSHICWHVFGIIQKGEKNYEEALKSYTQALKFDKENLNLLRDAAQLQTQLRQYDSLVETRLTILRTRPHLRQHWVALAVAHHLNGDLEDAKKVLEHYERSLKEVPNYDVEQSETLLYHIRVLEELGQLQDALNLLDVSAKSRAIVDRTAIMETRSRLLTNLGSDDAANAWRALIDHNPENYAYYRGYIERTGGTLESGSAPALKTLQEIAEIHPRATAPKRLALLVASVDDTFEELAHAYLETGLTKGVPSLFADLKSLYDDAAKRDIIEKIVESIRAAADPTPTETEPSTHLWTLYYLAQHHSYLGRHQQALELLDAADAHTPTLPELYTMRARVLKRAGDPWGAVRAVEDARLLDGQDRFLNTKSAKYRLRAGLSDEASALLGMFTKKDAPSPGADLEDMQSLLYLTEQANAHEYNGQLSMALKRYMAIAKVCHSFPFASLAPPRWGILNSVSQVFDDIEDDQYDFHGYSIRKFMINAYLDMLKWEDNLRSHPAYVKAAIAASRIWVAVHDDPSVASPSGSGSQLTDAEKKAKKKAAKKAASSKQPDDKKANGATTTAHEDKGIEPPTPKDEDPDGMKLMRATDGLKRAAKLVAPLSALCPNNIDAWIAIYDVAVRRGKYLQAAQALQRAKTLDAEHPDLHVRLVDLRHRKLEPPSPIGPVFADALKELLPEEVALETYNSQFLQRYSKSPRAVLAVAQAAHILGAPSAEVEDTAFAALGEGADLNVKDTLAVLAFLRRIKSGRADEFRTAADARFPLATAFKTPAEQEELKKAALAKIDDAREVDVAS